MPERIPSILHDIEDLRKAVTALEKEVKSLRGMVFLTMKKKKENKE